MQKMKIRIPTGYLIVEEKGVEDEYPGVFISFSKDGVTYSDNNAIATVEVDTPTGEIQTVTYIQNEEEPNHIIDYRTGRDKVMA